MKRPLAFCCFLAVCLLALRAKYLSEHMTNYQFLDGENAVFSARVQKLEVQRNADGSQTVLTLTHAEPFDEAAQSLFLRAGAPKRGYGILVYLSADSSILPPIGSIVTVSGRAFSYERATNPGQFDLARYYRSIGIDFGLSGGEVLTVSERYDHLRDALFRIRRACSFALGSVLPDKEAAMMKTMLFGDRNAMESSLLSLYQRNGIAHIFSISGLHISILGMGLYRLLCRIGIRMRLAALFGTLTLVLYGLMTGFSVSALRAIVMFALSMGAVLLKRSYDPVTALSLTAVWVLCDSPLLLYHSGFCFSFGCVLGLTTLLPALQTGRRRKLPQKLKALLGAAATGIISLPVYLWFDYRIPLYAPLLNLLILPAMGLLLPAGFLLTIAALFCPKAAILLRLPVIGILRLFEALVRLADTLPYHTLIAGKPSFFQLLFYLSLLSLVILWQKRITLRARWGIVCAAVLLLAIRPRGGFEMTCLDVGQGDGIFVRTAQGLPPLSLPGFDRSSVLLVDGGSTSVNEVGANRLLPFLRYKGVRCIDAAVITHSDLDHYSGILELLQSASSEGIQMKMLYLPSLDESVWTDEFREILRTAKENDIRVGFLHQGQTLTAGDALTLTCLAPEKDYVTTDMNESSVVLYLRYAAFTALLTGDIEGDGERAMTDYLKSAASPHSGEEALTVLKAAHHGSKNSMPTEFLHYIMPRITVISCGRNNRYHHPHAETLEHLQEIGTRIYRTDLNGAVTITVHGKRLRMKTFKGG